MRNSRAKQLQKEYLTNQKLQEQKAKQIPIKIPFEPIHMHMCLKNGIKIYYQAIDNWSGKIMKEDNGTFKLGEKIYKDQSVKHAKNEVGWWKVVEKLYTQEYLKLPEVLRKQEQVEVDLELYLQFINNKQKKDYEKQKG